VKPPASFQAKLFRYPGSGAWHFVTVSPAHYPDDYGAWGRSPAQATVDGRRWATSVRRGKDGRVLLPVPKQIRAGKGDGDRVTVRLTYPAAPKLRG